MTQFVIVHGSYPSGPLPGVSVRYDPLQSGTLQATAAAVLLPEITLENLFQVVDPESGASTVFFDAAHNDLVHGVPGNKLALVRLLGSLASAGAAIACWYGADLYDVPTFSEWTAFQRSLVDQVRRQPPEVYAMLRPAVRRSEVPPKSGRWIA